MNEIISGLIWIAHLICLIGCAAEAAFAEDLPRKEVEQLIERRPDLEYGSESASKWQLEVRNKKSINQDLLAMVDRETDWMKLREVFTALAQRVDLTEAQLAELKRPLYQNHADGRPMNKLTEVYIDGVFRTLENYPSRENEDLLLSFLDKDDGNFNLRIPLTLASMGTSHSLESLRKLAADLKSGSGRRGDWETAQTAIWAIEKRVSAEKRKSSAVKSPREDANHDDGKTSARIEPKKDKARDTRKKIERYPYWAGLILVLVTILGLGLLYIKRRGR